jgi:hypothetical protein
MPAKPPALSSTRLLSESQRKACKSPRRGGRTSLSAWARSDPITPCRRRPRSPVAPAVGPTGAPPSRLYAAAWRQLAPMTRHAPHRIVKERNIVTAYCQHTASPLSEPNWGFSPRACRGLKSHLSPGTVAERSADIARGFHQGGGHALGARRREEAWGVMRDRQAGPAHCGRPTDTWRSRWWLGRDTDHSNPGPSAMLHAPRPTGAPRAPRVSPG